MKRIGEKITAWKGPNDQKSLYIQKPTTLRFAPRTLTHCGVPEAADALAYEPVQRLLAAATSDGRVKIFGRYGVETQLTSSHTEPTALLSFLPNSGALLRVTQTGVLELFDLDVKSAITVIELNDDAVTCLSLIPGQPYILLGCRSGVLRVCCVTDGNMEPITKARPIIHLRLLNYRVSKHAMGAGGRMVSISACLTECGPLALMLHATSGVLIWNIRFSRAVCALPQMSLDVLVSAQITDPGEVTCVSWIGKMTEPYLFASGHDSGDVFTWTLPAELRGFSDRRQSQMPQIMHQFTVRPQNSLGSKIESISYISGTHDSLLIFGGQALEEPAGLSLFQLVEAADGEKSELEPLTAPRLGLAWFGAILDFVLVPPEGSMEHFDDPKGVIVLTESGNLVMHDLESQQPIPFSMPFQMCHKQCSGSHLIKLRDTSPLAEFLETRIEASREIMEEIGGRLDRDYRWVLSGGAAKGALDGYPVLILGYEDSSLRFWNRLETSPLGCYALERSELLPMAPIKALEVLDEGAFLILGDEKGYVFILQLSENARTVPLRRFSDPNGAAQVEVVSQEAGYQVLVCLSLNSGSIQKLAFHPESHLLAALDSDGGICIVNLITLDPVFVPFAATRSQLGIVDVTFCEATGVMRDQEMMSEIYLFLTDAASNLVAVDPTTGNIVRDSDWLHPKHESKSVRLIALDETGNVLDVPNAHLGGAEAYFWTTVATQPTETDAPDGGEGSTGDAGDETEMGDELNERTLEPSRSGTFMWHPTFSTASWDHREASMGETGGEGHENGHHARIISDDAETDALLAAALAKLEEEQIPAEQTRPKKGLSPWKRRDSSAHFSVKIPESSDGGTGMASPSYAATQCLLLVTETYLRLYVPSAVVCAVRAPLHKISFPGQIAWALPVACTNQETQEMDSGLVVLTHDGSLHLFALPSLEIMGSAKLDDVVDFPLLSGGRDGVNSLANLKLFEGDGEGGIYVCGLNGELIHFSCAEREDRPKADATTLVSLYDWELAHAAHSASHLSQPGATHANISIMGERPASTATLKKSVDFFVSLGRRARDEIDKAIRSPGRHEQTNEASASSDLYEPPNLATLFCVHDHKPPPEIRSHPSSTHGSLQEPILVRGPSRKQGELAEVVGMSPRQRTAEEVRAKYGRSRSSYRTPQGAADEVGSIMSENVSKLHERGDRLRNLNDRTEDLVNDAQNFAAMAKQLAQQKSKKWWHL